MSLKRLIKAALRRDPWIPVQEQMRTVRLGSAYGGWTIAPELLHGDALVYSAGVGTDVTFDLGIIEMFGARVHAFDPTPRSARWVASSTLPPTFVFHQVGLAGYDGHMRFAPPVDPSHVSYHSSVGAGRGDTVVCPVRRISTIMQELGHTEVDLLKMDIEGAEYEVIADLATYTTPPTQLLVEFHHRRYGRTLGDTVSAVRALQSAGYSLFHVESTGREYSFRWTGSSRGRG